jgi:hypothetical protein
MAAITTTIDERTVFGNKRVNFGHFTCGANTGGEINTGLTLCEAIFFFVNHSAVHADAIAVNETLPIAGSAVTVVHTNSPGGDYRFMAIGH